MLTEWMLKSFSFTDSKLWNKPPLYIRNSDNLEVFKKALQKFSLEFVYYLFCLVYVMRLLYHIIIFQSILFFAIFVCDLFRMFMLKV